MNDDIVIVGGGVIGLSLAWRLALRGARVRVLERGQLGREASWAGAGILPPAPVSSDPHPVESLASLSRRLHREWAEELRETTGVDTGYRECGGLYLARSLGEAASLRGLASQWGELGERLRRLDADELSEIEPELGNALGERRLRAAFWSPGEAVLRNPRHLQALVAACRTSGVHLESEVEATGWNASLRRISEVQTTSGPRAADAVVVTAGAWSGPLLRDSGLANGVLPIRGQILMYAPKTARFGCVINEGSRYLVPRDDGRLLVGSCEEEVGFQKATTPEMLAQLQSLAESLLPYLRQAPVEASWSGLRPGSFDGLPYIGKSQRWDNLYVATGHFRAGLALSTGTAEMLRQLILEDRTEIDLAPFRVDRG